MVYETYNFNIDGACPKVKLGAKPPFSQVAHQVSHLRSLLGRIGTVGTSWSWWDGPSFRGRPLWWNHHNWWFQLVPRKNNLANWDHHPRLGWKFKHHETTINSGLKQQTWLRPMNLQHRNDRFKDLQRLGNWNDYNLGPRKRDACWLINPINKYYGCKRFRKRPPRLCRDMISTWGQREGDES